MEGRTPPDAGPPTTLEGVLERVTFTNPENAWSVVKISLTGRSEPVTVVGNLLGAQPGETLRLTGTWVNDRRFGEQFRADSYLTVQPATLNGIRKYLGSGLVRGLGPGLAERLVERFGLATLDVIDADADRLREVEGIGPLRSARIREAWVEQRGIRDVMVFLQSHGVTTGHAVRIWKRYGERAIAIVRQDPYRLATDIVGIGFRTADSIASGLGVPRDAPRRAQAAVLHVLGEASSEGHVFLPREELVERTTALVQIDAAAVEAAIPVLVSEGSLVLETGGAEGVLFLKALHAAETGVAGMLRRLCAAAAPRIEIDIERALAWFEQREGIALEDPQKEAIRRSVDGKVLVVTGGPGTGKTTLVSGMIRILERKGRRILLAAPTGRAAKRLEEAAHQEARTIHRLLEFRPGAGGFQKNRERPLACDLLIVDEASMLDIGLFHALLSAVPVGSQLVLVGDVDQIPSVGPGRVLEDLIRSGAVEVVRLSRIFRQAERSGIVVNAHRVNRGEMPALDGAPPPAGDFVFIEREDPAAALALVQTLVAERIPRAMGVDPVDGIQVLTPMHRGLLGAASLNAALQTVLNPAGAPIARGGRAFRVGDKVMQIRNNYDLDVFNGDLGRIEGLEEDGTVVRVRFDGRRVRYDGFDLDQIVLAYACSIHKAQGSEYPCVVVPLHTQHYVMLRRNLLYTAITRGRRLVVLVGSRRALGIAVRNANVEERHTRLAERLGHAAPE